MISSSCGRHGVYLHKPGQYMTLYMKTNIRFFIISPSFLRRMKYVSDKTCGENQNTHFMFSNSPPLRKSCGFKKMDTGSLFAQIGDSSDLDTGFPWFPCVYKQMLRWFPTFQVATTCFSCSPPNLNLAVNNFIFCVHVK